MIVIKLVPKYIDSRKTKSIHGVFQKFSASLVKKGASGFIIIVLCSLFPA